MLTKKVDNTLANKRARICPMVINADKKTKHACHAESLGAKFGRVGREILSEEEIFNFGRNQPVVAWERRTPT